MSLFDFVFLYTDDSSAPPDSSHIYQTINVPMPPPPQTNQEPGRLEGEGSAAPVELSDGSRNSVYAQVTRKLKQDTPPDDMPEVEQVEKEEEESSPPLPDREI